MTTTIAAVSTAEGTGGIGIVRLSGPNAVSIVEQIFRSYHTRPISSLDGFSGTLGDVVVNGEVVDQVIVFRYQAPKSYTGEDVVEISGHGGNWVNQRILRACFDLGALPAAPGEFTKRAFLNGKIDLFQAEAVADLIMAQDDNALLAANDLRTGRLSTSIDRIVEKIQTQAAHLAAWSDYPDEDMEMVDVSVLVNKLKQVRQDLEKLLDTFDDGRILRDGISTIIVGKPNVGKSTLMNYLNGFERSIVTEIAGTTRDIVEAPIRLGSLTLHLADTAGLRQTNDVVEQIGVDRAKAMLDQAALVFAVFDSSQPLSREDGDLIDLLEGKNVIAFANKGDLAAAADLETLRQKFRHLLVISAKDGTGLEQLEALIVRVLQHSREQIGKEPMIFNERQRQGLRAALASIIEATEALDLAVTLDAVNICLEDALQQLLALSGKLVRDEVVNQVFAQFCVGK